MITKTMNTALTGLNAASNRLHNSANNVANQHSTSQRVNGKVVQEAFEPKQVTQTSLESGGVRSDLKSTDPATIQVFQSGEGLVDYPNVDLEEEVVNQQLASYDFKANLKVIETADEMAEDLLDITA